MRTRGDFGIADVQKVLARVSLAYRMFNRNLTWCFHAKTPLAACDFPLSDLARSVNFVPQRGTRLKFQV